ncbi:hypothetical protein F4777DRAFT_580885 [Nemania sp. FL0916]|nr:hypothetical protein F4777DRAFT_580885 [Nemania sp. FL0916]
MKGLEAIWRVSISKDTLTAKIIDAVCGDDSWDPVDVPSADDLFFAFLGSDHGKGPARMLANFPEMFGHRFVHRLRLFPHGKHMPDMCWYLEEVPAAPPPSFPPPPSSTDRPMSKKREATS